MVTQHTYLWHFICCLKDLRSFSDRPNQGILEQVIELQIAPNAILLVCEWFTNSQLKHDSNNN